MTPGRLKIATWNLRGLQTAGFSPWPDFPPYSRDEYEEKLQFLAGNLLYVDADVVGIQEVAEEQAFLDLHSRVEHLLPHRVLSEAGEGSGLRVGLFSALPILESRIHTEIPSPGWVRLTPDGPPVRTTFRRPVLSARIQTPDQDTTVFVVHLKAKRPDYFPEEEEAPSPIVISRAMGRSLVVRGAEAAGLRALLGVEHQAAKTPVALIGDFNDGLESVTTQILGRAPPRGNGREGSYQDGEFYNTLEIQRRRHPHLSLYTHIWEEKPDILDHIVVSADLARRFHRLRIYNDFLEDSDDDRRVSDHGCVVATFRSA